MKLYKSIILAAFVCGIMLAVFIYQACTIYQMKSMVNEDHNSINSIVNFLNNQITLSNGATKK